MSSLVCVPTIAVLSLAVFALVMLGLLFSIVMMLVTNVHAACPRVLTGKMRRRFNLLSAAGLSIFVLTPSLVVLCGRCIAPAVAAMTSFEDTTLASFAALLIWGLGGGVGLLVCNRFHCLITRTVSRSMATDYVCYNDKGSCHE